MTKSIKIGNRRLLKLSALLRTIPNHRFSYVDWVDGKLSIKSLENHSCGTTGCALGWATTMPIFKNLGLRTYGLNAVPHIDTPRGTLYGADAATELFALDYLDANYLFHPHGAHELKATPDYVADKIEHFVEWRKLTYNLE